MQNKKSAAPFRSVFQRRTWTAARLGALLRTDSAYYSPMLAAGDEGRALYHKRMSRCTKPERPTDLQLWSYLLNVKIPIGLDEQVETHCQYCLPCMLWLGRMNFHFYEDRPGKDWSEEVGKEFPMLVKGWDRPDWHLRVHLTTIANGPSFHLHTPPLVKSKAPVVSGSCAGVFCTADSLSPDLEQRVGTAHKKLLARAKLFMTPTPHLDIPLMVSVLNGFGFVGIEDEITAFLSPYLPQEERSILPLDKPQ